MHFFSPANVDELLRDRAGGQTAPDALTTAVSIARKIAKCRLWSASATASSATGCWRNAASRPKSCC